MSNGHASSGGSGMSKLFEMIKPVSPQAIVAATPARAISQCAASSSFRSS
jgi:hypothetical protein